MTFSSELSQRKQRALRFTQRNEDAEGKGDISRDPIDSGGPTRWGITDRLARAYKKNLLTLTEPEAAEIMLQEFWRWDWVRDEVISCLLFDWSVMSGIRAVNVILQLALNSLGAGLKVDGVVGPATRSAVNLCHPNDLEQALRTERDRWLKALVQRRPKDQKYLKGWIRRTWREVPA